MKKKIIFIFLLTSLVITFFLVYSLYKRETKKNISTVFTHNGKTVRFLSDTSLVKGVNITNQTFLDKKLTELNFWQNSSVYYFKPTGLQDKQISVNTLIVHITDKEQTLGQVYSNTNETKNPYESYGMTYNNELQLLNLLIYISPQILMQDNEDKISTRISQMLLSSIFDITHPIKSSDKQFSRFEGKNEFIKPLFDMKNQSFISTSK